MTVDGVVLLAKNSIYLYIFLALCFLVETLLKKTKLKVKNNAIYLKQH